MTTELAVAEAIASGELRSPAEFAGNSFFAVRFSGTGCAWRESLKEFCWRGPEIWLSPEMQRRVVGVPLIVQHPDRGVMAGGDFHDRVIGICVLGFAKPEVGELWAVARIVDKRAAALIDSSDFDTSPSVIFEPTENQTIDIDGDQLLIEGSPMFLDHLAIVTSAGGVWSKGNPAAAAAAIETSETETVSA